MREVERTGRVSLLTFYARRAKRLLPAASLVLVATGLLSWLFIPRVRWAEIGGDLVASAAYLINWRLADRSVDYLAEDSVASPVQHYWSLAVEEQFYLVWPLLIVLGAWLVNRHRLRTRPVLGALLTLVVVSSLGWSVVATAGQPEIAYFVTTTRLWELGIGGLIAITSPFWQRLAPGPATGIAWVGLLALLLSATILGAGTAWPGHAALLPTLGTAAVIAGGFAGRTRGPVRFLGVAPMRDIGATSYSLYLWHWPLLVVAAAAWGELSLWQGVAIAALSYIPARLTYALVENPIRSAPVMSRLPTLALALGAACTVLGAGAGFTLVRGMARGCSGKLGTTEVIHCVSGDPDGELIVAVVGDSKIGQWGDVLEQIATDEGWQTHLYTRSGCTWTAASIDDDGSCLQWGQTVRERLLGQEQPDVVIVSGVKHGTGGGTGQERRDRLAAGYVDYWSDLEQVGVPVIVLSDTPNPGENPVYECVSEHRDDVSVCAFDRSDGSGTRALRDAAEQVPSATFLTMNDWICPLEDCPPVIGDVLVYRQGSHITNTYAVSLLEPLRARLVPAVEEAVAALAASSR